MIAGVTVLGALAAVTMMVGVFGEFSQGGAQRSALLQAAVPASAEPVYYVPLKAAPVAQPGQSLAAQQPVVYYYVPKQAQASLMMQSLNATGNATGGNATGAAPAFSCAKPNLIKVSAKVQTAWTACQLASSDYKEPNKDAKRRLMGWVWEGPNPPPGATVLANATNATAAAPASAAKPSLSDCQKKALGDTCVELAKCGDPVCTSYYNEPEIEALCGMCTMGAGSAFGFGCFARDASAVVEGKGTVAVGDLSVGDSVMAAGADGAILSSKIYFIHDHKEVSKTMTLTTEGGMALELTPAHMMPIYTEECGDSYCAAAKTVPAKSITAGSRVYVSGKEGSSVQTVSGIRHGTKMVRYLLTEAESVVVGGVVSSVHSTAAGALETLPFRFLNWAFPGALQLKPIAATLAFVLESPMLQSIEAVVNAVFPAVQRRGVAAPRDALFAPAVSF